MSKSIRFHAVREGWSTGRLDLYLTDVNIDEKQGYHAEVNWVPHDEGAAFGSTISIKDDQAQQLMDSMWRCGIRPTWEHSEGQLGATRDHLNDLRKLLFKKEGVDV